MAYFPAPEKYRAPEPNNYKPITSNAHPPKSSSLKKSEARAKI